MTDDTRPNEMDYHKLKNDEALDILRNEVPEAEFNEYEQYIEDAVSVLYWHDADGDFEQAVRIQGLPEEIPMRVARALNETDYDFLAHTVETHDPTKIQCAGCGQDMYEFKFNEGYNSSFWITEWGDHCYDEIEFLSDPAAPPYWQADPDGDIIACTVCHHDGIVGNRHGGGGVRREDGDRRLVGFHDPAKTMYNTGGQNGTVVRDDWYWFSMDNDHWEPMDEIAPWRARDFFPEYVKGRGDTKQFLADHDYVIIDRDDIVSFSQMERFPDEATLHSRNRRYSRSGNEKEVDSLIKDWACADEAHPEISFPYFIDMGSDFFVHEDNADELRLQVLEDTLFRLNQTEGKETVQRFLEIHRFEKAVAEDDYAELSLYTGDTLITDWEGDGVFNPHVHPSDESLEAEDKGARGDAIAEAIWSALNVTVHHIEWDDGNECFFPHMDAPEVKPVGGR